MKERIVSLGKKVNSWIDGLKRSDWKGFASYGMLALFVVLFCAFLLFNYTNYRNGNWLMDPVDHEAYVMGKNLRDTGHLSMEEPLNDLFQEDLFLPSGTTYYEGKVVPTRALGFILLCAFGFLLGDFGPFCLVPLLGLICLVFLYKLVKLTIGDREAILATLLFGFSAPFVYWNNMLFPMVPAVAFLVMGLYFLAKIAYEADSRLRTYLFSFMFFAFSIWLQYEFVIVVVLLLSLVLLRRRKFRLKYLAAGFLLFLIVLMPILLINNALYGNAFGVGYTVQKESGQEDAETDYAEVEGSSKRNVTSILKRFFNHYVKPDVSTILNNFYRYVFRLFPMLVIAGCLGLFYMLSSRGGSRAFAVTLALVFFVWVYQVCNSSLVNWGGKVSLLFAYHRYLMVVYLILAICAPVIIERLSKGVSPNAYRAVLFMFVTSFIVLQVVLLMSSGYSLRRTVVEKSVYRQINESIEELPANSIVVTNIYSKGMVGRPILRLNRLNEKSLDEISAYFRTLLEKGYHVYLLEPTWHKSYRGLGDYFRTSEMDLEVQTRKTIEHVHATDELIRVDFVREVGQ